MCCEASPWETRRLKAELAEAKTAVVSLENRLSQTRALHKEMEIIFDQEKNVLQQSISADRNKVGEFNYLSFKYIIIIN